MKFLLFGGSGQLGFEIQKRAADLNFEVFSPDETEVNISEARQVLYLCSQVKPDLILNCAAYTAVDKAEQEQDLCFKINAEGARNVAQGAKENGARLIHISTDYVFDGELGRALREDDPVNPLSVYGKSKLAGEQEILKIYPERSLVVRTASLYGQRGINFVRTMLELFKTRELVKVVSDQYSSPTWAGWLAEVLLDMSRIESSGVVHAVSKGAVSWYDFAVKILELSRERIESHPNLKVEKTTAAEFARPAPRPRYSELDCSKLTKLIGRPPITWQDALATHLKELGVA